VTDVKEVTVRAPLLMLTGLILATAVPGTAQSAKGAPETFSATAKVSGRAGAITAEMQIQIRRYTPDFDRKEVEDALRTGGYPKFLTAVRKAPDVGSVGVGDQQVAIRYARERETPKGRTILVVTEKPIAFVGGSSVNPKSRAGYEVGVIELTLDGKGGGTGVMAAAARVKPGGETGVRIDDYAEKPINLTGVTRKAS
jgi:hypothetical protein